MKTRKGSGEVPGWDAIEAVMAALPDMEPPDSLTDNIMAAVAELPLPRRLELVPVHQRAELSRTLVIFTALLAAGGVACLLLAPALFFGVATNMWLAATGIWAVLSGVGNSFNLLTDALVARAWQVAPTAAILVVAGVLAAEWHLLGRVAAGRVAADS